MKLHTMKKIKFFPLRAHNRVTYGPECPGPPGPIATLNQSRDAAAATVTIKWVSDRNRARTCPQPQLQAGKHITLG